jgi:hypothetical protein
MKVYFETKITSNNFYYFTYIVYIFLTISAFTFFDTPIVNLFCTLGTIFLITLNYRSSWLKKFSAVFFIYFFMFTTDLLVAKLLGIQYISVSVSNVYQGVFGYIAMGLMFYFEALLAQNLKNIKKHTQNSIIFWISSFVVPLSSIYLTVILLSIPQLKQISIISAIIIIFLINILTFYLHDSLANAYAEKLKYSLLEQEKEYYYNQCEIMNKSTEELKSFKHDVKNLLSTAIKYIEQNETSTAKDYLKKLTGKTDTNRIYSNTGNVAFDSIINYKLRNAEDSNISLNVNVSVPQKINVEIVDIVIILGNLLDNALNAVMKVQKRQITLKIAFSKGNVVINIQNSFDNNVKYVNGEIVTITGEGHGYGLKNVRNAIEKYSGYIKIDHTENLFSVDVFLYGCSV